MSSPRSASAWRSLGLLALLVAIAGCSPFGLNQTAAKPTPSPTPVPFYTLAGGGDCVKLGSNPQPPFANVRVSNDSFLDHSEPMLAENPNNPLQMVGGSKFFTNPKKYQFEIGYYYTSDGGCTWTDGGLLPGSENQTLTSDISFAYDDSGNAYALVLNNGMPSSGGNGLAQLDSGLLVLTSHDGGKTFGQPVSVIDDAVNQFFNDKPWIAVDRTHSAYRGSIYVVWSYDLNTVACQEIPTLSCSQFLGFSRSTDGGQTFAPVREIQGTAPFCTNPVVGRATLSRACDGVLGAIPTVLPDGTIVVTYAYIDLSLHPTIPTRILAVRSTDGGATWSSPALVATIHDIPYTFPGFRYRNAPLPALASDPATGQIYVAWSDYATGDSDILLATSTDEGLTWSTPVRVNDDPLRDGANQFQPQLAVAPDGVVSVTFFDTRNDPTHKLIDVYLAQSIDHGATFLPNIRVTTQSWDPTVDAPIDGNGLQFIGDYQGLSADNYYAHPFWNDTRTGDQEIFTAAIPSAQPPQGAP